MRRDGLLVGVLGLQVRHHLLGFLVPQPLVVVHEGVAVVGALGGHLLGDGRLAGGRRGVWVMPSIYKAIPRRAACVRYRPLLARGNWPARGRAGLYNKAAGPFNSPPFITRGFPI